MGILTRIVRLCKADIHGVMDQMEDRELLLRQHLRDMEKALSLKEVRLKKMTASCRQAQQEYDKYKRECEKMEQDLTLSIEKDRDDIARLLIRKLKPMSGHKDELGHHIEALDQEIAQLQDCVDKQRLQYEQFRLKSSEYYHKTEQEEWRKSMSAILPDISSQALCEEEIELELLQRKEAVKGGSRT
jgi:phage shock protein A